MKEKTFGVVGIGSAILASSCCILPIIAATFSFGIGGTAAFFDDLRPYLLGVTFLMLGSSFYLVYFKKTKCDDGTCETKGSSRSAKIILWASTGFAVVIALFPNYSEYIF